MPHIPVSLVLFFWLGVGLVVYAYAGYPLLICALAAVFGRPRAEPRDDGQDLPVVSLLIAAHNEEQVIGSRLDNALRTEYPSSQFEIVVASDGSRDRTAEITRSYADRGVRLLDYPQRRGKAAVLNSAFRELTGSIVVLSDANTSTEPSAIRKLVRWFQRPETGVVCGRLVLTDPKTGLNVDSMYWRYETFLKKHESRLGGLLGANGGIYAVRRALFVPIDPNTIVDDFVLPLTIKLHTDCDIVYDADAVAHEETPPSFASEFARRCRIGAGDFQSLPVLWRLLDPRRGWIAFTFLSHKVLRWLCPFLLAGVLLVNAFLLDSNLYRATFVLQLALYGTAALGSVLTGRGVFERSVRLTTLFTTVNLALLIGFWRWASGRQRGTWERTAR
jgi:cellulose synthase/poly-beta-1,6-N-acetylglucosamine synthase-like glycosyltransferase